MSLIQKYAFRKDCCQTTWGDNGNRQTLSFDGPCIYCKKAHHLKVDAEAAIKFRDGGYAQNCFPELTPGEREFLISGICSDCWDKMFKEDEE